MNSQVPQGWKKSVFADVVKLEYGKSPKDIFDANGKFPVIGTGGVTGSTNSFLHQGNTTVIGRKGTINSPSFITSKFWPIDTTYFVSEYRNADPKWFYYLVQNIDLTKFNEASGVPSLNRDTLYAIPHVLPPIPEQQKIASILTAVDEVIESTTAQINKLKDLKTGMMQELLTKGIGHTEFKDSPVGRIPKAWKVMRLKEITLQIRDGNYGADYPTASELLETGIPFLTSAVISSNQQINRKKLKYISQEKHKKLAKAHIATNDVLFTNRGANVGDVALVPSDLDDANIGPQLTFLRTNIELCTPDFLYYSLQSDYFKTSLKQLDSGSAMNFFGIGTTENFILAIPPRKEQDQISAALNLVLARELACEQKFRALQKIKNGLMQDLLTGKVRVNAY